jgi:hypothetical protein
MAAVTAATRVNHVPLPERGRARLLLALVRCGVEEEAVPAAAALVTELDEWTRERNGASTDRRLSDANVLAVCTQSRYIGPASQPPTKGPPMTATSTTKPTHLELAEQVARATKLKHLTCEERQNGNAAVIVLNPDGEKPRVLAFIRRGRAGGVRVHTQHYGSEEQMSVPTIAAAAAEVKKSERRSAKKSGKSGPGIEAAKRTARQDSRTTAKPTATSV